MSSESGTPGKGATQAVPDLLAALALGILLWAGPGLISLAWAGLIPGTPIKAYFLPVEIFGVLFPTLLIAAGSGGNRLDLLRWRPADRRFVLWATVGAAGLGGLLSYVQTWWEKATGIELPPQFAEILTVQSAADAALLLVGAVMLPAFAEESAFRGFMLGKLQRFGPWVAIATTTVLFAAFHHELYGVPTYLAMGVYLGWLSWRARSIWPAAAAHATNNLLALAQVNGLSEAWWWANALWLAPLCAVLAGVSLRALLRLPPSQA